MNSKKATRMRKRPPNGAASTTKGKLEIAERMAKDGGNAVKIAAAIGCSVRHATDLRAVALWGILELKLAVTNRTVEQSVPVRVAGRIARLPQWLQIYALSRALGRTLAENLDTIRELEKTHRPSKPGRTATGVVPKLRTVIGLLAIAVRELQDWAPGNARVQGLLDALQVLRGKLDLAELRELAGEGR